MESAVKQRVMEFIRYKRIPIAKFENLCGLSCGYIRNMRKGFGVEKLNNITKMFPELNPMWLLYGDGEMLVSETPTEEKIEEIPNVAPAVAGCVDCRILQVRLEEKQATIDSLRDQLDKAQDANRQLMELLKTTVSHADTNEQQKKKIG